MSAYFGTDDVVTDGIDFDFAEAVTAVYAPGRPIDVKRIILVIKEASNGAEVITVAVRNKDDTPSTTIGTFTIPSGLATDTVLKVDIANVKTAVTGSDASQPATVTTGRVLGIQTNQPGVIEVNPGQEISLTSTGGTATTGQADVYFSYVAMGNQPGRFDPTDLVFTHA